MSDTGDRADELWERGCVSEDEREVLVSILDRAFEAIVFQRFGGMMQAVLARGGAFKPEQVLRDRSGPKGSLLLELHLRGDAGGKAGAGAGHASATMMTPIGLVRLAGPPAGGLDEVHVLTEIFDPHEANSHAERPPSHEGVGLEDTGGFQAGSGPGGGLTVIRAVSREPGPTGLRGWQAPGGRLRTSRAVGLGSNGRDRSTVSTIRLPVAAALLGAMGKALASASPFDTAVERLVVLVDN